MVGWHHLNGHGFEQALGDGEEQGSLACCSPWVIRLRNCITTTVKHLIYVSCLLLNLNLRVFFFPNF